MTVARDELTLLLYRALSEPIGLVLASSQPDKARQRLYAARAAAADPDLSTVQIRMAPDAIGPGMLVLVRGMPRQGQQPKTLPAGQSEDTP